MDLLLTCPSSQVPLQCGALAAAQLAAEAASILAGSADFGAASDVAPGSDDSGSSSSSARRPHTVADFYRAYASGQATPSQVAERVIEAVAASEAQVGPGPASHGMAPVAVFWR